MTLEAARLAIVTAVDAAKTGAPVSPLIIEYDNRILVDTQTQTKPFLCVKIIFIDGYQADLSESPTHRVFGQIHLAAAIKEGQGSALALGLLDHFYTRLQRKQFGIVRTMMADMAPVKPHLGWNYYTVLIPFWFDKIY